MCVNLFEPARLFGPCLDVGPVPAGTPANDPPRLGEKFTDSPHGDGMPLDAEALGDVVRTNRVADVNHGDTITCNARLDKCEARRYSRDMTRNPTHTMSTKCHHGHQVILSMDNVRVHMGEWLPCEFVTEGNGYRVRQLPAAPDNDGTLIPWYQAEWDCHPGVSVRTKDWQEAEQWGRVHIARGGCGRCLLIVDAGYHHRCEKERGHSGRCKAGCIEGKGVEF